MYDYIWFEESNFRGGESQICFDIRGIPVSEATMFIFIVI